MYERNVRRLKWLPIGWVNWTRKLLFAGIGLGSFVGTPLERIFILGHMRAGSSLLTLLVTNNPEVVGYGELHLNYKGRFDLMAMVGRVMLKERRLFRRRPERYILDKVLHNYLLYPKDADLIVENKVRTILLVRQPRAAVSSMVNSFGFTVEWAANYYMERVNGLVAYIEQITPHLPMAALDYDDLVNRPDDVFALLGTYLELEHPITNQYAVDDSIAKGNDPSQNLKEGRILQQTDSAKNLVEIPDDLLEQLEMTYQRCRQAMSAHCQVV